MYRYDSLKDKILSKTKLRFVRKHMCLQFKFTFEAGLCYGRKVHAAMTQYIQEHIVSKKYNVNNKDCRL
jgi:hypothetical protein